MFLLYGMKRRNLPIELWIRYGYLKYIADSLDANPRSLHELQLIQQLLWKLRPQLIPILCHGQVHSDLSIRRLPRRYRK